MTLLYAQESGFIQILLEFCISKELLQEDKGEHKKKKCKQSLLALLPSQRYTQGIISNIF
jgi:hypothetical protein